MILVEKCFTIFIGFLTFFSLVAGIAGIAKKDFTIEEPENSFIQLTSKAAAIFPVKQKESTAEDVVEVVYKMNKISLSAFSPVGVRLAEPSLERGTETETDDRIRIAESSLKFRLRSKSIFDITESGGILYLSNPGKLNFNRQYRINIEWSRRNGVKKNQEIEINFIQDNNSSHNCNGIIEENNISCSRKWRKEECLKTCGLFSGSFNLMKGKTYFSPGCRWRVNDEPENLSRYYQTCSPDLNSCPDGFCDPLEEKYLNICPQDCSTEIYGSAMGNSENKKRGVFSATGICSCDSKQKCFCGTEEIFSQDDDKDASSATTLHPEVNITAVKDEASESCGLACLMSLISGSTILLLLIGGILVTKTYWRKQKRCPHQRPFKEEIINVNYENYVERGSDLLAPLSPNLSPNEKPEYFDKKWEFPRHRLIIEKTIDEGEFGKVLKARADGIAGKEGTMTVAVKTLKENAKHSELVDLISEFQLLKQVDHPNVIHLLGACTTFDGPLYIIIEFAEYGSLRNYLRRSRQLGLNQKEKEANYLTNFPSITPKDILTFAWQIAKGMAYLAEMKLVHRDLAARNVLVAEGLVCKISDFGLTRDVYEDDAYFKKSKGRVPVKWMALESLDDHVYTSKSDVWSYGILLWELVTGGASPYPGVAVENLYYLLKSGYRMEKPPNCSEELYQILRCCWQENAMQRPTFTSLVSKLEEMLSEGKNYLDLNPRIIENRAYFSESVDETQSFIPNKTDQNSKKNSVCECPPSECMCDVSEPCENENLPVTTKPKYVNEITESDDYVRPNGDPKPVGETGIDVSPCKKLRFDSANSFKALSNANFYVKNNQKEICDVKRI